MFYFLIVFCFIGKLWSGTTRSLKISFFLLFWGVSIMTASFYVLPWTALNINLLWKVLFPSLLFTFSPTPVSCLSNNNCSDKYEVIFFNILICIFLIMKHYALTVYMSSFIFVGLCQGLIPGPHTCKPMFCSYATLVPYNISKLNACMCVFWFAYFLTVPGIEYRSRTTCLNPQIFFGRVSIQIFCP